MMDEARFGLHAELRRIRACKGQRPVVARQIKYQWDYLYGSLDVIGGQAHSCQIPSVNQGWDAIYLKNLEATDPNAIHVVIRDQAGFHLRDGDPRLPARVRIIRPASLLAGTQPLRTALGHESAIGCPQRSKTCARPSSRHFNASGKSPLAYCVSWVALGYSIK